MNPYGYYLYNIEGIGPVKAKKLLEIYHSSEEIYKQRENNNRKFEEASKRLREYENRGIHFVGIEQKEYPALLKHIYNPPIGLFYIGSLPTESDCRIAVVGGRECSNEGKMFAKTLAGVMSEYGIQVVSGMARGIDGFAHEGALQKSKETFAVLGNGVDVCYPKQNEYLYRQIISCGGILSEYEPGTLAKPEYFPMRNRIISGLCHGVVVIEAKKKSGSLITASFALEQNRDVFCVPGNAGNRLSMGCNALIKDGANLIDSPEDILNFYKKNQNKKCEKIKKQNICLETTEKMVYANLCREPKHIETIIREIKVSSAEVWQALLLLEQKQLCVQVAHNYFIRNVV